MTSTALLVLALALPAPAAAAAAVDKARLAEHIHKAFSTPATMKIAIGDFSPSPVAGWLMATAEVADGERRSAQPLLLSEDGRWYFLGALVELKDSEVPGMRSFPDEPGLPPVQVFGTGRHAVLGFPKDFSADPDAANLAKIGLGRASLTGPADAAVTVVEYSDLQCPHCKKSHDILAAELPKLGVKVRRAFKHYPLPLHDWAYDAAVAAACAARAAPAAGDALRERFFAEQESITAKTVRAKALEFAKAAKLPADAFQRCYDDKQTKDLIEGDREEADSLGIAGTPTIFINGRRVRGYQWPDVKAVLDEMAGAKKP
ncbi:MAG: thioredoxin domain-containing protein [Elusimicrobia bacterium]|nr:thioredoxin domain-containing protein [Elusimicrobiota bacterium]